MIFTVPSGPDWLERAAIIREKQRLCEHDGDTRVNHDIHIEGTFETTECLKCGKILTIEKLDDNKPKDMWGYDLYKGRER